MAKVLFLNHGGGEQLDYTLSGTVAQGDVIVAGDLLLVALSGGDNGDRITVKTAAQRVRDTKASGAMSQGDEVFWDASNNRVSKTATVGYRFGRVVKDAASGDATVDAAFEGPGYKQTAVVAALTDNSGGAAADGTIGAVTTFTPSVAWNGSSVFPSAADATAIAAAITALMAAVKELSTKVNEIVAAQKTSGQMANS